MEFVAASWCREVVETLSNYKKPYSWQYANPTCGDSIESNWIEKDQNLVPPGSVWGQWGEETVWYKVCGVPLDDCSNSGYVDNLFTCGECSFSSFESWSSHSKFPAFFSFRNSARNI